MDEKKLEKRLIEDATVNQLFGVLSAHFEYDYRDWLDEIVELQTLWQEQGFVEIYPSDEFKDYGRIKDSSLSHGASPYYIGIYHARLLKSGENDPLVVVKFHETETGEIVDMKLMLDHDEIFGSKSEKYDPTKMREIRKNISSLVDKADVKFSDNDK